MHGVGRAPAGEMNVGPAGCPAMPVAFSKGVSLSRYRAQGPPKGHKPSPLRSIKGTGGPVPRVGSIPYAPSLYAWLVPRAGSIPYAPSLYAWLVPRVGSIPHTQNPAIGTGTGGAVPAPIRQVRQEECTKSRSRALCEFKFYECCDS